MTLPTLVLVHGGQHAADCWDLTVSEIHRRAPDLAVLALDLPGRRGKPGDLLDAHIDDWVDSLLADIDDAGIDEFVIVGHSLAGLTVPGVVATLGPSRVREMVLAPHSSRRRGPPSSTLCRVRSGATPAATRTSESPELCQQHWRSSCSATA